MYDFEPSNGNLLSQKMFSVGDVRIQSRQRRRKIKRPKIEKRLRMTGEENKEFEGKTDYPVDTTKKIFGMKPKTLGIALGIVVISIWVISKTGGSPSESSLDSGGAVGV